MALEDYDSSARASSWILQKGYPFLVRVALARAPALRAFHLPSLRPAISAFGERNCSLLLSGSDVIKVSWFVHLSLYVRA
jgi:hypothetical protein